jgi:alpha-N-arabinofuranosidase
MQAHNTFDKLETVKPAAFSDCKVTEGGFTATLPAKSVVVVELK